MISVWCVAYLHDWDPDGKVYAQVHSVHHTWQEAEAEKMSRISSHKYHVCRSLLRPPPLVDPVHVAIDIGE